MRKFKINSAAITPSNLDSQIDEEFLQDMSSTIVLEDGSSIDLRRARLLYNPDTKQIQLTDAEATPKGFAQLATLRLTEDEPDERPQFDNIPEELEDEDLDSADAGSDEVEDIESTPEMSEEDSGDFFQ